MKEFTIFNVNNELNCGVITFMIGLNLTKEGRQKIVEKLNSYLDELDEHVVDKIYHAIEMFNDEHEYNIVECGNNISEITSYDNDSYLEFEY